MNDDAERSAPRTPKIEIGVECPYSGDDRPGALVSVPFSDEFLSRFKDAVEHGDRRWNPEAERWWVVESAVDEIREIVAEEFGGYQLCRPDGPDVYRDGSGEYEQTSLLT